MKKKILSSVLILATSISLVNPTTANARTQYDITYNDTLYNATFKTGRSMNTYDNNGATIGKMFYTLGKFRYKQANSNGTYQDSFVVRMQMDPQKAVKSGNTTRWGVSEYLKVSATVPTTSINKWNPVNQPKSSTWNIGLTAGTDKSASITASTDVVITQLDFEADVQISNKKMNMIYDYKPSKGISWSSTKNVYVRNSSMQYAMISYNAKSYTSIPLTFNANFTWANDKDAKPANVVYDSMKGSSSYTWVF